MAKIGEKSRNASAARQNQNQALATTERRANRTMGHRIDVIYKYKGFKLGCIEIGNDSITRTDNRYMNDGMIKLPKCLGDMFYILANEHPERINNLVTYNLIIINMNVELAILNNPTGSTSRLNRPPRYKPSFSVVFFATETPVVLGLSGHSKN
ncbi:hypothetical protein G6F70_008432 [Rhizopus microsporus]|uniref:Uncharacterized protein n=2 Tax=Rhizopus TaxID=4842 RepID=A0A367K5V8_RHIAZ|nr:hypothetical protein G6F71_008432 [Rhizopus microsporus]RCH97548.1 hypothetical protein CU097_007692 [Rhizopus azygosporus]KAG1195178.1 hypothetical protein G6F70_008432 [Rhizopus microsporus]KAG1209525.1 hypothetical protein G6F69_006284 [Rhizopus microsporus]KAG1227624.1 hypothetical protein G6F67_008335 [Rhizopus microsporus]